MINLNNQYLLFMFRNIELLSNDNKKDPKHYHDNEKKYQQIFPITPPPAVNSRLWETGTVIL